MRVQDIETFTPRDWAGYFQHRVMTYLGRPTATPTTVLARVFESRLSEVDHNATLVGVILDDLLIGESAFVHQVGPTESLLTLGVFNYAVRDRGGYDQHWRALYYRRFARTDSEVDFFIKYLALLDDAQSASSGAPPSWNGITFTSWHDVEKLARMRLDQAVATIKRRFKVDGPQAEWEVSIPQLPPTEVPPLVQRVKQGLGTRIIQG